MRSSGGKLSLFWSVLIATVAIDLTTKAVAVATLSPIPQPVIGDFLYWQLAFNPGAAFGIDIGPSSRWFFSGLVIIGLFLLGLWVRATRSDDWPRLLALALVCGGATGNLIDRLRSPRGVVDFIDVGAFGYRLPNFNVADVAIVVGAVWLTARLLQQEAQA